MKKHNFSRRSVLFVCLLLLFSLTAHAKLTPNTSKDIYNPQSYYHQVEPEEIHPRLSFLIAKRLELQHYTRLKLDNKLSSQVFDAYIKSLDPQRSVFTQKDINEFDKFRYFIDDAYERGILDPAYLIFNIYQIRSISKLIYQLKLIDKHFATLNQELQSKEEQLQTDREKAPWMADHAGLEALWKKQLKNIILSMRLNEKDNKEIRETLSKRLKVQLNRFKQTKSEDAFRTYINALAESYDPHTQYFSPRVAENFDIQMKLSLEGIGALLQEEEGYTKIKRLIPGGPAHKAGQLKAGDRIIGVAQQGQNQFVDVVGWRLDDVVQLIRGKKGTRVRLKIIRGKQGSEHASRVVEITRDKVNLEEQSAKSKIITVKRGNKDYRIGVIDLPTFYMDFDAYRQHKKDYRSTTRDVKKLLLKLKQQKVDGVVLDLRDNGGGSLQEVSNLLGLFVRPGPTVLIKSSDRSISDMKNSGQKIVYSGPLAVMINRLSASASEIFAGAIQDYHRGIILGSRSFGKGTVQTLLPLPQGQLKLTHAKFYRVNGDSTQNLGVLPDIDFPAIYDVDEIGESSLPHALPWDQINPDDYQAYASLQKILPVLNKKHRQRIKTNPDFIYLQKTMQLIKAQKNQTIVSLNENKRRKKFIDNQNKSLAIENERRKAKGEPPYADIEAMKKALEEKEKANETKAQSDIETDESRAYLREAAQILSDYIQLQTRQ